jgi:hypothetical protein
MTARTYLGVLIAISVSDVTSSGSGEKKILHRGFLQPEQHGNGLAIL